MVISRLQRRAAQTPITDTSANKLPVPSPYPHPTPPHPSAPQQILRNSRVNATKVIFLITDGYSNGGDPRPVAAALRERGVEIFTLGIWQGNIRELHDMASSPKDQHCYLVHNFEEFEALARYALHEGELSGWLVS